MKAAHCQVSLLLLLLVLFPQAAFANALSNHMSLYLAMHGNDPVDWRDWGEAALDEAEESGKLLFISSGYFSCHWCHVMQQESYQDDEIAAMLNKQFVSVKIDRELQPALDAWLIEFTETTEGTAGWPLNVFLTPDGYPLIGTTYLPRDDFQTLLGKLTAFWESDRDKAVAFSRDIVERIRASKTASPVARLPDARKLVMRLIEQTFSLADELQGGFGDQNKFPMSPQLHVLMQLQHREPSPELHDFLVLTLDQMAGKGLRDQLAGGFFRYTIDPGWETPHYEKMLYNQAQLASLYLFAADVLNRPDYRVVAMDTLDFVLEWMRGENGGYISSLSALDEAGVEGGSYLWSRERLASILSEQELEVALAMWEFPFGTQLPGLALPFAREGEGVDPELAEAVRLKLLAERAQRAPPRDTKQLAAWNGLLLKAFAQAAVAFSNERYTRAAEALARWCLSMWDGRRLSRSNGQAGDASLADYLYVADGLRAWGAVSRQKQYRETADEVIARSWQLFFDDRGWRLGERQLIPGLDGEPAMQDGPMPAPSALAIALDTGEEREKALRLGVEAVVGDPFWFASHAWQLFEHEQHAERRNGANEK
jgi:uncharacterized protein YyaL (SSP411 family)